MQQFVDMSSVQGPLHYQVIACAGYVTVALRKLYTMIQKNVGGLSQNASQVFLV